MQDVACALGRAVATAGSGQFPDRLLRPVCLLQYLAECEAALEQAQADDHAASQALVKAQQQVAALQVDLRRLEAAQGEQGWLAPACAAGQNLQAATRAGCAPCPASCTS